MDWIIRDTSHARWEATCGNDNNDIKENMSDEWKYLCSNNFTTFADNYLLNAVAASTQQQQHIIQIGAHTGFEVNDPFCNGMLRYINQIPNIHSIRSNIHWTFVEPSPPNFKRLIHNTNQLENETSIQTHAINTAIVSDNSTSNITFYSISDTVDPETGYDTKSGKTLPSWITQVSGLSNGPILFNRNVFRQQGLNVDDYIVPTVVTTMTYSNLVNHITTQFNSNDDVPDVAPTTTVGTQLPPLLVLIDTEGYDCMIIQGLSAEGIDSSSSSTILPQFIIFESHQCKGGSNGAGPKVVREETHQYLESTLGYTVYKMAHSQNSVAIKKRKN